MDGKFSFALFLLVIFSLVSGDETPSECYLPAEAGLCYAYFQMFFYDASAGKCQGFIYGGCGGNENRFWTEEECMDHCGGGGGQQNTKEICNLEKDGGNCDSYLHRYYFDKDSRKCERFVYTGCGGNDNNFGYEFECERYCPGDLDLGDICSLEPETGMCMAAFRRYYFNNATGQCEEFIFGGCDGNHNNFYTVEECESFCPSRK